MEFRTTEDGKKALEQMNNFDLAGKNIRITVVEENCILYWFLFSNSLIAHF